MLKLVAGIQGMARSLEKRVSSHVERYTKYASLWEIDKDSTVEKFVKGTPTTIDFEERISHYETIENEILASPSVTSVLDCVQMCFDPVKSSLKSEAASWKYVFGAKLNSKAREDLLNLTEFMTDSEGKLQRKIETLDDVRELVAVLKELREVESEIDFRILPLEQTYAMLTRHGVR
ncbi:hypothetical protein ADUPG1_003620, partial [Aduncisulcus paluster]